MLPSRQLLSTLTAWARHQLASAVSGRVRGECHHSRELALEREAQPKNNALAQKG